MLLSPVFIIRCLTHGVYINHRFFVFRKSFIFRPKAFRLYAAEILLSQVPALLKARASIWPLFIALLIPSKELGLMNPAASPIRYMPSFPVTKSRKLRGLEARHASVLTGEDRSRLEISISLFFCSSKARRQFLGAKHPPYMRLLFLCIIQEQLSLVFWSNMQE